MEGLMPDDTLIERTKYLFLFKYTDMGIAKITDSPGRIAAANKFVSGLQAFCGFVSLSGEYDMMTFFDGTPEAAYKLLLYLRSLGSVQVTMCRVETRSPKQYAELIQGIRSTASAP
jgi:uncharacterized protein with GYD domain